MEFATYYFKTYFVLNWDKTTGRDKTNIDDILIKLKDTSPSFKQVSKNFVVKLKQYFINLKIKRQSRKDLVKLGQSLKAKLKP